MLWNDGLIKILIVSFTLYSQAAAVSIALKQDTLAEGTIQNDSNRLVKDQSNQVTKTDQVDSPSLRIPKRASIFQHSAAYQNEDDLPNSTTVTSSSRQDVVLGTQTSSDAPHAITEGSRMNIPRSSSTNADSASAMSNVIQRVVTKASSRPFKRTTVAKRLAFLDSMLEDYDKRAWPTYGTGIPTDVVVSIYVNSFGQVNAANMDFNTDIYLRMSWNDARLKLPPPHKQVTLNAGEIGTSIWTPDIFFKNVKEANFHFVTVVNKLIKLNSEGDVLYSVRLTLRLACNMSFRRYPMDTQRCPVVLGMYAQTVDQVQIRWKNVHPIQITQPMEISEFDIVNFTYSDFTNFAETGNFSFLQATFVLVRQQGYHLIQTYLPTFLLVIISWVSFWLNVDATPARVTLGVTTLLTLTTVAHSVRMKLPPVSYVKAIDMWIGACSVMVFGALLEFTLVNYLSRSKLKAGEFRHSLNILKWKKTVQIDQETVKSGEQIAKNLKKARRVDMISRSLFPLTFFVFNIIYWFYYIFVPDS